MQRAAVLCAALAAAPVSVSAQTIRGAVFTDPTTRYAHGILGDAVEWGGLQITVTKDGSLQTYSVILPQDQVFEDLAPRLWDITGDGAPEVVVVLSQVDLGASLVVLGVQGGVPAQIAATPHIGRSNRWLAPVGAADLDGDGRIEIAYVDRPHLAKLLRVWEWDGQALQPEAELAGLTNHRIGEDFITGGLRDCGAGPQLVTVDADWQRVMATRLEDGQLTAAVLGAYTGPAAVAAALSCAQD